jgi:hypothetical protein
MGGLVGPRASLDDVENTKLFILLELDLRPLVCPAVPTELTRPQILDGGNSKCQTLYQPNDHETTGTPLSVTLLRYVQRDGPVEEVQSCDVVRRPTAEGLASVLKQKLAPYENSTKLILHGSP